MRPSSNSHILPCSRFHTTFYFAQNTKVTFPFFIAVTDASELGRPQIIISSVLCSLVKPWGMIVVAPR